MKEFVEVLWLMSIQASILILVVLLIRFALRNYKKIYSYCLWLLVLVRLLCPVFIESDWSLQPDVQIDLEAEAVVQNQNIAQEDNLAANDAMQPTAPIINADKADNVTNNNESTSEIKRDNRNIIFYLQVIYLVGMTGFAIYFLVQYFVMKKRVAFAIRDKENIWLCEQIDSPFVMGVIKPRIYLPFHISDNEKRHILRHEQAHITHMDPLVRMLGSAALILHWWNPLVWYAIHKMNQDMEMFCDETALANAPMAERKAYSNALLHFSMKQSGLAVTLSFGESNTEVRIKNVLRKKRSNIIVATIVGVIGILCAVVFLTSPETDENVSTIQTGTQSVEESENHTELQVESTQHTTEIQEIETESQQTETSSENSDENYYELTSTLSKSEIEMYAKEIRNMILNHDWERLSEEINYPIKIAGEKYSNAEELLAAPLDSIVTEEFMQGIKDEDCEEMFHNWSGIMMGETGDIWIGEFLDVDLETHILQVITINIAEPEPEPIIEGEGTYASEPWYSAYQTIINDWTTIDQYGDFSYLKGYFDIDYQFDNYWLCDIDSNGVPELLLHSDYMNITAAFTYYDNQIYFLTYDVIYGINKETGEIVVEGHWHGAGGSGVDEWTAYQVTNNEVIYSMYIDFYREYEELGIEKPYEIYDPATGEYERQTSAEEYDKLYTIHVTPCILKSEYQRYTLNDLSGLDIIQ